VQIARAVEGKLDRFTVELQPVELGRIAVKLEFTHDDRVIATFHAERPETLILLERDARQIERMLQESGLKADSGSLRFTLGEDRGGWGREEAAPRARLALPYDAHTEITADDVRAPADRYLASGRVDIHV